MNEFCGIVTYPVGLLTDLKNHRIASGVRYLRYQINARNWRAVRNYFNGYLAEWDYPPEGVVIHQCGRGWTRRAALRSFGRRLVGANLKAD